MVNKFIGDGIMALFGAPVAHPDDARRAIACGLHMIRRNEEYNQGRAKKGLDPLVIGIGIHTGEAVVGTIGAREKMEYTAIGNTVNVSARVEGENKKYNSRMLVTEDTYKLVREDAEADLAGHAELKGIDEPVALYKIVKLKAGGSCSLES
jgi:adenylate cyclase